MKKYLMIFLLIFSISIYSEENLLEKYGFSLDTNLEFKEKLVEKNENVLDKINFELSGEFSIENRKMLEESSKIESKPEFRLGFFSEKENAEMNLQLEFNEENKIEDILKEGYLRLYFNKVDIEIGKTKVVWGKTDGLHVIDNLNPMDWTDSYNDRYLERKVAQEMLKMNFYLGKGILETAYIFGFEDNTYQLEKPWGDKYFIELNNYLESFSGQEESNDTAQEYLSSRHAKYDDAQVGIRYTNSFAKIDYGLSYYKGYLRQTSFNKLNIGLLLQAIELNNALETAPEAVKATLEMQRDMIMANLGISELSASTTEQRDKLFNITGIAYDRINVFGTEFSTEIYKNSIRGEFVYIDSEDNAGTDPNVINNRVQTVFSIERGLPLNNIRILGQLFTQYVFDKDKIKDNKYYNPFLGTEYNIDVDCFETLSEDYENISNILNVIITDSYVGGKFNLELEYFTSIEDKSFYVKPKFIYKLKNQTEFEINYSVYGGESSSRLKQFEKNDYLEFNYKYKF